MCSLQYGVLWNDEWNSIINIKIPIESTKTLYVKTQALYIVQFIRPNIRPVRKANIHS